MPVSSQVHKYFINSWLVLPAVCHNFHHRSQFWSQFQLPKYQVAQYNNLDEMSQYSALSPPRLSACLARATNASLQSPHGRGIQVHRYYPGAHDEDTTTGKASLSSSWSPLASYLLLRWQDNELLDVCDDKHRLHLHCLCRSLDLYSLVGPDCSLVIDHIHSSTL